MIAYVRRGLRCRTPPTKKGPNTLSALPWRFSVSVLNRIRCLDFIGIETVVRLSDFPPSCEKTWQSAGCRTCSSRATFPTTPRRILTADIPAEKVGNEKSLQSQNLAAPSADRRDYSEMRLCGSFL